MSNFQDKVILSVTALLLFALLSGGIILGIRLIGHQPKEIVINTIDPPVYTYQVSIDGAVANPGAYPAKGDDTLISLINAAGLNPDADTGSISIHVSTTDKKETAQKVNINYAERWLLEALPGIGPSKAQSIIDYRQQKGLFKGINEVMEVDGIGKSLFDQIKDLITTEG